METSSSSLIIIEMMEDSRRREEETVVTHPSTNRVRRRVTSLIRHNVLPLCDATNHGE